MTDKLTDILREYFPDDVWDDSVEKTSSRIIQYWEEFKPKEELDFAMTTFPAPANNLVICKDIEFSSICAHHLLPFYGKAHVGYIPNKLAIGLSKIPRLVDFYAKRPQMQERLTEQIAHHLKDALQAHGVMVVIEARHTCMACRGVRKHNGTMVTSSALGVFLTASEARAEFLDLIGR